MFTLKKIARGLVKINALGLVGIMLAGSLAWGFKPVERSDDLKLWGKNPSTGVWQDITDLDEHTLPPFPSNTYQCVAGQDKCTVLSETQPADHSNPTNARDGSLIITP